MDVWNLVRMLVRRWFVALPLIALIGGTAGVSVVRMGPSYTATAYVQLIPPGDNQMNAWRHNPWLDYALGPESLGHAAVVAVTDQRTAQDLGKARLSEVFTVALDEERSMVTFEVVGHSPDQVEQTGDMLVSRFNDSIISLQNVYGVPQADVIRTHRLDRGTTAVQSTARVTRAIPAVAAAAVLILMGTAVALDALLQRRRRRVTPDDPGARADRTARCH